MESDPIARWLLEEATCLPDIRSILQGLIDRLGGEGLPLIRVHVGIGMLHPEIFAAMYSWERGDRFVKRYEMPHGIERTDVFRDSPFRLIVEGGEKFVRRHLVGPNAQLDFPVLEEIRDAGGTDFLAMALPRSDKLANPCSFTTDRPGGFSPEEVERLLSLRLLLALIIELKAQARITRTLLDLYLGTEAGSRVYRGQIKRGGSATIRSVLWMSDLRRFTSLSEDLPLEPLTAVLNDYFDAAIGPIQAHGGEVLKLMGDGVLGIFRIENENEVAMMCDAALNAASRSMSAMSCTAMSVPTIASTSPSSVPPSICARGWRRLPASSASAPSVPPTSFCTARCRCARSAGTS
jgi:adenylate cyclase